MTPEKLQDRAERLAQDMFLGGPVETFEAIGRLQLITLLRCGLYPDSRVLDLGCGSLRGGYWLVHFLRPERYFGIEPNAFGAVGAMFNFAVAFAVAKMTAPPPQEIMDLVEHIRVPSGGETTRFPDERQFRSRRIRRRV